MSGSLDDKEIKQVHEKTVTQKEKEKAIDMYTGCMEDILAFEKLLALYKAHKEAEQTNPDYAIITVGLKCALIQTVCIIGDRLTWLRKGKWGRDQYGSSPLFALAKQFNSDLLEGIIQLRNNYAHSFLYVRSDENLQIEFKRLLNITHELSHIQKTMKAQIEKQRPILEHYFVGEIASYPPEHIDISDCWSVALRQTLLLEHILNHQSTLETTLKAQGVNAAIDGCIKNICQAFYDYRAQIAAADLSTEKAKKFVSVINGIQQMVNKSSTEHLQAYALLENSRLLKNHLAHPNMKQQQHIAKIDRVKFLRNYQYIKSLLQGCFALARKQQGLPFSFSEIHEKFNDFYSYMRKATSFKKKKKINNENIQPLSAAPTTSATATTAATGTSQILQPHNVIPSAIQTSFSSHLSLGMNKPLFKVKQKKSNTKSQHSGVSSKSPKKSGKPK